MPKSSCHSAEPADVKFAFVTLKVVFLQRSKPAAIRPYTTLHVVALWDCWDCSIERIGEHDVLHFRENVEDVFLRNQRLFRLIRTFQAFDLMLLRFDFSAEVVSHT